LATLWTGYAAAGERDLGLPALDLVPPPAIIQIPAALPSAVQRVDGSWVIPPDLAEATERILIDYRHFPDACAASIRAQAEIGETRAAQAVKVATSRCVAEHVRRRADGVGQGADGVPWWQVGLGVAAAGVAGLLLGVVLGMLAGVG
jgi:ElaB/YqjD/DUF883 family membrane-anchored ribosome-binding protein